ncbi:oxidoreductase [Jiangella aurantiaca]|uniref:Oxidoreductase n=1 Tax=Jiangella aurantiaca TaxID=2530373 RepID=A0A4R5AM07_9ACTN|nr:PmoA family protein [Jiangella aurantiaca]TDD72626.1 oxidoreductase [Jiangella aurantiaca]
MSDRRLQVTHAHGADVTVSFADVPIARYVYAPDPDTFEAPKPYLHPLRTIAGDVVTGYRPHDHRWHKGLQLTATDVSGHNLWGGNTYVPDRGYVRLDNVGAMRPDGDVAVAAEDTRVRVRQDLTWTTAAGDRLCTERRALVFGDVDEAAGSWTLAWTSEITNATAEPLVFGSPTTHGRPNAGYAGLFWRGPRSFTGGQVLGPRGEADADEFRGTAATEAPWLAFVGHHDEVDRSSTLVFVDDRDVPGTWFVRATEFAAVNPSWAFHETFALAPGATTRRAYQVAVADGAWDHARVDAWVSARIGS